MPLDPQSEEERANTREACETFGLRRSRRTAGGKGS